MFPTDQLYIFSIALIGYINFSKIDFCSEVSYMFVSINKDNFKLLNKIAIPLIVQNISCMSIGLIDQMFIGRISADIYGAIGVTISLMNFMAGIFGYFAVAFHIIGSKKQGEENKEEFREVFMSSLLIDFVIGVIYGMLTIILCKFIFKSFYGLSGEALTAAVTYSYITCPYMLFQLVIFSCSSYFKVKKNTSKLMFISTGASILNTILDYIFIFGKFGFPKLGTVGAATATIISVFINMLILLLAARKDIVYFFNNNKYYLQRIKELIKTSLPLAGEELLEGSIFVLTVNAIISNIGINEIGAYLLAKNVLEIILISMYMYGSAELTLVGEKIGQHLYKEIKKIAFAGVLLSCSIYVVLSIFVIIFKEDVPKIISNDKNLISLASKIMVPMVIMNLFNPIQTVYKYVLQACSDGKYVLYITAFINMIAFIIIMVLYILGWKLWSVFIGLFVNYVLAMFVYLFRLKKVITKYNTTMP